MKRPNGAYVISKATMNFTNYRFSYELENEGFTFTTYHPGFSITDTATSFVNNFQK